jgi:hypothetical protein
MRNNGTVQEDIEVWFPFGETRPNSKGQKVLQVKNLQVWVEEVQREVTIEKSDQWNYIWAHWPVSFPIRETVEIRVTYTITENLLVQPFDFDSFLYIMETGAGWEGVIEEAVITVKAPYPLEELDELLDGPIFYASPEGYTVTGSQLQWVFKGLEPTEKDNIDIRLLNQETWTGIKNSLSILENDPDDWEANLSFAEGLRILLRAQEAMVYFELTESISSISSLKELTASSYRQALDHNSPNLDLYHSALSFFHWNPELIESNDLQAYFYQAINTYPDDEYLQETYQRVIEDELIKAGPPASPTSTKPEPSQTASTNPISDIQSQNGSTGTTFPLLFYLVAGIICLGGAAALIIYAINSMRTN